MSAHDTRRNSRSIMREDEIRAQKIILFDGVCNLCNGSVLFVLKYETDTSLHFASIQSEAGQELLNGVDCHLIMQKQLFILKMEIFMRVQKLH
jgi:predicted DCC family thiol-disulfide oxidoreductase YuxK